MSTLTLAVVPRTLTEHTLGVRDAVVPSIAFVTRMVAVFFLTTPNADSSTELRVLGRGGQVPVWSCHRRWDIGTGARTVHEACREQRGDEPRRRLAHDEPRTMAKSSWSERTSQSLEEGMRHDG
jgi:hypothetical protein